MSDSDNRKPGNTPKGQAARQAREERSAKALRDNLRRRKMQVRGRRDASESEAGDPGAKKTGDS